MTSDRSTPSPATSPARRHGKGRSAGRYLIELLLAFVAYGALLAASLAWLRQGIDEPALRLIVTLSPMLSAPAFVWVILREFRRQDELHQKLQFEALVIAFVGTALMTFSYGFLENIGYPRLSMFSVWPVMAALWVIALLTRQWRYRRREDDPPFDDGCQIAR